MRKNNVEQFNQTISLTFLKCGCGPLLHHRTLPKTPLFYGFIVYNGNGFGFTGNCNGFYYWYGMRWILLVGCYLENGNQ